MPDLIEYLHQVSHLKRLPRTGWLFHGVQPAESVADHTCVTALLAVALAAEVNRDWADEGLAAPLDVARVAQMALVHDLAESELTDLPRRSTELIGSAAKRAAEAQAMRDLAGGAAGQVSVLFWQEYAAAVTPEAQLVRDADKLEMVHQALCYEEAGNRGLDEFWEGHQWRYRQSAKLYAALRQRRLR